MSEPSKPKSIFEGAQAPQESAMGDTNDSSAGLTGGSEREVNLSSFLSAPTSPDELGWLANYRVLKVLGRGGMGVVLRAEDIHLQRIVALKVILPEIAANPVARERFLREARAGAQLKSDHVVTIYQVGQDNDVPFLAMEFLEGESLETRMEKGDGIPFVEICRIGKEAAAGLATAHAHGLIHRDIKPGNIWLEAGTGRAKLLDFGLARAANSSTGLTRTGTVIGTPDFMSPEQARGEELDARSDLFSLGAILYTMCSGHVPFQGSSVMAVLTALAVKTAKPVREINPDVPEDLAALIDALLQKDPSHRPETAQEVSDALGALEMALGTESGPAPATSGIGCRVPGAGPGKSGIRYRRPGSSPSPDTQYPIPGTREQGHGQGQAPVAPSKSFRLQWLAGTGFVAIAGVLIAWFFLRHNPNPTGSAVSSPTGPPIKIGVLHSRTGTMTISERPVIDAVLLAVEEINAHGGLLGRPVQAVQRDGQSDESVFALEAENLIQEDKVCAIFGCWTSASRKAVVPVVEKHNHLLIYPVQYEGMEQSPNVIYLGPVPNQQILPALRWIVGFEGKKRWFLVGSDYIFPVLANAVIHDEAKARGCTIVGEEYLLLGSTDTAAVVKKIDEAKPDLIVNTINGDTNVAFFRALRQANITSKAIPAMSFSVSVQELNSLGPRNIAGNYLAATYFQGLDNPENQAFVRRFHDRYGSERVISDPMETAYVGVYLWAKAVEKSGTDDTRTIRESIRGLEIDSPQGSFRIDPNSQHTTQIARIGRIDETGKLKEVFLSPEPIRPEPYPASRTQAEWTRLVQDLHQRWGGRWSNTENR
jgi:urea transport system substrate-binding protein